MFLSPLLLRRVAVHSAQLAPRVLSSLQHQVLAQAGYGSASVAESSSSSSSSWSRATLAGGAVGAFAASLALSLQSTRADAPPADEVSPVVAADPYQRPPATGQLPKSIVLYQYEVCPFCCKVKAFLDYHKMPYYVVEVNPLTKTELKWSTYKKVPVVQLDGEVVVDSTAIISRLAAEVEASGKGGSSKQAKKGWFSKPAGEEALEEETQWRKWVDERLVKVVTANIYRNWDESWGTFSYMTQQSQWGWATQQSVRLAGAVMMWQIGKRMPRKYHIEGDLRQALYGDVDEFIAAVGSRKFMGGDTPNLADLAAYGVLKAVQGTDTYNDVVVHTSIGPWLVRMSMAVGDSSAIGEPPADGSS